MGTITVLRPSATSSGAGWSAQPGGTLHGVTSDNSDATYALWSGDGSPLILSTPADTPPVGERRHQVRLRARGEDGNAWWSVQFATGATSAGASAAFSSSPSTVAGSWGFGAPPDGSTVMSAYVTGQSSGVKINELFLDVDSREQPSFTPQVLDGTGAVSFLISDTTQPVLRVNAVDLDGLNARQYRYWVTSGADIVWDTGIVSGPAANQQTSPLDNGDYTGHFMVWSTIGQNGEYASEEGIYEFTVQVGQLVVPDNPTVVPVEGTPFYEIEACAPYVGNLDGDVGWIELQRVDCNTVALTIATFGPLETGECATWTDFTIPRSGVGATCQYSPEPCCSYYRVRTVGRIGGELRVSVWSDVYNPAIPAGMIIMWPSSEASIPEGWDRVAELDGRYPKGIPSSSTEPGSVGGAATHTHSTPGHVHDETHAHGVTGNTGTVVGTVNSADGAIGTMAMLQSHFHTRSAVNSGAVNSGSTAPSSGTGSNHPAWVEGIAISSNGTALGVPDGAIAPMPDISPSGWDTFADATGRFLRSPATGFGGGATAASTVDAHTHSVDAHTHTGTSHSHTSPNTGGTASNRSLLAGPTSVLWTTTHSHPVTVGNAATASLASASGGTSGAAPADLRPPFVNVRVRQNNTGAPDLPIGLICAWRGDLGAIPDNWALCDGTGGTLNLLGRYLVGATTGIGTTGGSAAGHTHTGASHTHSTSGHSHSTTVGSAATATTNASSTNTVTVATGTHTHTSGDTDSATPTVAASSTGELASSTTEPPFGEVAFVQLMELPTPPPEPETFCLTWDASQHLIRTTGPAGPMWAPVLGKFDWTVTRPFTVSTGVNGSRFVTTAPPGGRNLRMSAAVESESALAELYEILSRPLVLISPSDAAEVWAAPVAESVRIVKVGRIRQVTAEFIGTGPEPAPQLADVGA